MRQIWVALALIWIYLWGGDVLAAKPPKNKESLCGAEEYYESIRELWKKRKPTYLAWIKGSDDTPYNLYNIQGETNNLLKYAGHCRDRYILEELLALYMKALETLDESDEYVFSYYPGDQRQSVHNLEKKYRIWLSDKKTFADESVLSSSQFLYLISDAVKIIMNLDSLNRSSVMREFVDKYIPVLAQHYKRWILDKVGPFQVRGWGCKIDSKYVETGMNHAVFLQKKLKNRLGDNSSPAYCNAVTDTDLWIIAGVSNLLAVSKEVNLSRYIDRADLDSLYRFLKIGMKLLESRISYTNLKDFNGVSVVGANFDLGMWDDYPELSASGVKNNNIFTMPFRTAKPAKNVGWDLSHARRFVHVLQSLYENAELTRVDFPSQDLLRQFSNQLLYAVFNGDLELPLFTNFMSGENGWFRINYMGREGFGYGPWDMSIAVLTGGFGFWSRYNSDMEVVFVALTKMLSSKDPTVLRHMSNHYERNYWSMRKHVKSISIKDESSSATQVVLIQFLPSMCYMRNYGQETLH